MENKVLMSQGWSWVSVKNCPDSHLELPTYEHSYDEKIKTLENIQNDLFYSKIKKFNNKFYIFGRYSAQQINALKLPVM